MYCCGLCRLDALLKSFATMVTPLPKINYYINEPIMCATLENASRTKKQLLAKCILSASDGMQMEQGHSFTHCCT